jgi:DNA-binding transcriptional ArsR family regulator
MDTVQAAKMSQALKSFSDVNRIRILEILSTGEHCVTELVERLQIDQPKVSHHLAILRSAGVIRSRRDGRHINYSVRPAVHQHREDQADVFDVGTLAVCFRFGASVPTVTVAAAETTFNGSSKPVEAKLPLRLRDAQIGA